MHGNNKQLFFAFNQGFKDMVPPNLILGLFSVHLKSRRSRLNPRVAEPVGFDENSPHSDRGKTEIGS